MGLQVKNQEKVINIRGDELRGLDLIKLIESKASVK